MFLKKIMTTAVAVLALGVAVIAGGSLAFGQSGGTGKPTVGPEGASKEPIFKPTAKAPVPRAKPKEDKEMLQGTWHIVEANAGGKHQAIEISKEQVWVFTGDRLVINYDDKSRLEMSYQIDPKQKPKAIDLSPADEREKGYVFKGIYELDGDRLKLYYSRNVAPDAKRPERFHPEVEDRGMRSFVLKRAPEKEAFTAWGKEVGGLQAGLGFRAGEKRAYHTSETLTLVVRVRNVGKQAVKFEYLKQFLDEHPPTVTDADGKAVALGATEVMGFHSRWTWPWSRARKSNLSRECTGHPAYSSNSRKEWREEKDRGVAAPGGHGDVPPSVRTGSWELLVGVHQARSRSEQTRHRETGTGGDGQAATGREETDGCSRQTQTRSQEGVHAGRVDAGEV